MNINSSHRLEAASSVIDMHNKFLKLIDVQDKLIANDIKSFLKQHCFGAFDTKYMGYRVFGGFCKEHDLIALDECFYTHAAVTEEDYHDGPVSDFNGKSNWQTAYITKHQWYDVAVTQCLANMVAFTIKLSFNSNGHSLTDEYENMFNAQDKHIKNLVDYV